MTLFRCKMHPNVAVFKGRKKNSFELFGWSKTGRVNRFTGPTTGSDGSKVSRLKDADWTEMMADRRSGF